MSDQADNRGSGRGHGVAHTGGEAIGNQVRLPRGASPPITVYINGVEQSEGVDYRRQGGEIVFREPIVKEGKLGFMRWLTMWLGVVGTYRRNETIDIEYRLDGKTHLASDCPVLSDE